MTAKHAAVTYFQRRLAPLGTPEGAAGAKAYMKSELRFFGTNAADLRRVCREFCKEHPLDARSLRRTVDALYATDWFELRSMGVALLEELPELLAASDAPWLLGLVRASPCWAHVDYLATQVVDPLVALNPALLRTTRTWAKDKSFWVRRTALLAQLRALRRGGGDFALFARIAAPMLEEKEFFIRKAIGWVLREVAKKRPALVRDFLQDHGARVSPLTWREASKYLPETMRKQHPRRKAPAASGAVTSSKPRRRT